MNIKSRLQAIEEKIEEKGTAVQKLNSIDLTAHIAPVYTPVHEDIQNHEHSYINLPGGRGSCKSSFVSLEIVGGIMKDLTGESSTIVFRRYGNTMRESVYAQISWAIEQLGVSQYWRGNVSPMQFTFLPTGAQIIFRGLDDSSKLKSIKPRKGIFRYIWFEEFSELPGENFTRSVLQSVQRGGEKFTVFRSFNPPISASNWANIYIQRPDPRGITLHTSYLDVPAEWLGEGFIYEAERLKEINEAAYKHEYLGEATGTGGEVFPNITVRNITDEEISRMQYIYAGIDFGFSIDPAVFIRVAYDRKYDTVYLLDEIYKKHMSNNQLADEIKAKSYDKTGQVKNGGVYLGNEYYNERQTVICASAEPKSISDLQNSGIKAINRRGVSA